MSVDPTQPMSRPASPGSGSGSPEQPAAEAADAARPAAAAGSQGAEGAGPQGAGAPEAPPTRPTPLPDDWSWQSPQPSFTPAQPSFTPTQPAHGGAGAGTEAEQTAAQAQPGQGTPGDSPEQDSWRGEWPQQPPQYTPEPGWPESGPGGMPGGRQAGPGRRGGYPGSARPRRRHPVRRSVMALFTLIVVLILLVIGDRVANAVAENTMADQFVQNGFPVKPSVNIEGFPFLTQLLAHDLRRVDISASNVPVNVPVGQIDITSIKATVTGLHINSSFNGGTADHVTATVFVSFSDLAGGFGSGTGAGITLSADGPNEVKITAGLGPLSDTEVAKITQTGPSQISVQVLNSGGLLSGALSSLGSFSFNLPKGLPASLRITNLSVTPQGLSATATASDIPLTEPSS